MEQGFGQVSFLTYLFCRTLLLVRNLCYSTLVSSSDLSRVDEKLYKKSENGHAFVHSNVKKGILPTILEELLSGKFSSFLHAPNWSSPGAEVVGKRFVSHRNHVLL